MDTPPLVRLPASRAVSELGAHLGTLTTITIWHDFLCPWCWVALIQAEKLSAEFGVTFDWRGAELFPPALQEQMPAPKPPAPPVEPVAPKPPPSRFDLFAEAEGATPPRKPPFRNMRPALLATEYIAVRHGQAAASEYVARVYRAYWDLESDISDVAVLSLLADGVANVDSNALTRSVDASEFAANILQFDDDAYAAGIRHVPTFVFGGEERLAEASYASLAHATERFLIRTEKYRSQ